MRLEQYIKKNGYKKKWVAEQLGITYNYLSVLLSGRSKANEEILDKIKKLTKGEVSKNEISNYKLVKIEDE